MPDADGPDLDPADGLRHILRPRLPWRSVEFTECGHPGTNFAEGRCLTFLEAAAAFRRLGKQRAAMVMCMTCVGRVSYGAHTGESLEDLVARESNGMGSEFKRDLWHRELAALAALVVAHRDEFDGMVAGLEDVTGIAGARERRRQQVRQIRRPR